MKISKLFPFLLALILFNQCDEYEPIDVRDITIDEVKAHYQNLSGNPNGRQDETGINWENGVYKDLPEGDALLFPLKANGEHYVSGGENIRRFAVDRTSLAFAYKQLNDEIALEQIQMVPTTNSDPFTGFITVSDWNGEVKHAFHYVDGIFQPNPPDEGGRADGVSCGTVYHWWCTAREDGADYCVPNGTTVSCEYTSDMGIYESLASLTPPDSEGGGGTGGSSNADGDNCTSPIDPTVSVPCNDNTCGEGMESDGNGECMSTEAEEWEQEVCTSDSFDSNDCLEDVWNKIKSTNAASSMLDKFENSSWIDLCIDANLSNSSNAQTSVNGSSVTINFNTSKLGRSQISITRTFLHEMVHAELFRKVKSVGGNVSQNDFPGIYDYYRRFVKNWQHQQMAAHYINSIANSLQLFDEGNHELSYYKDIAWIGLWKVPNYNTSDPNDFIETQAWQDLSSSTQDRIKNAIATFQSTESKNCE